MMLTFWMLTIMLCFTTTELSQNLFCSNTKRTVSNVNFSGEPDNLDCCRICHFRGNILAKNSTTANICKRMRYDQTGIMQHTKQIHKWSLVQLMDPSGNVGNPVEELFLPAHLSCSLMIITLYGNLSINWLEQLCDNISQPSLSQPLSSCIAKLELIWLKKVIKTIAMVSENMGDGLAMKVDGEEVCPGACFDTDWLYEYVCQSLPKCVMKYVGTVLTSTTKVIASMSWSKILNNPYLFYRQHSDKFDDVFKIYGLPESREKIKEEINIMLEVIYTAEENDLLNCNPLQTIFIIHLIHEKQLENNVFPNFNMSFEYFKAEPSLNNFQKLIFKLGTRNSMQQKVTSISHFKWFRAFIAHYGNVTRNLKIKLINFWIAKMVLYVPYKHLYFLCYILFKENLMKHFNTWMVFRCSLFIRRLLIMIKKGNNCTFEKTNPIQRNYRQMRHFSIGSYVDMFNDIRNSLLLLQRTRYLDQIERLKKKSIKKTYKFCTHTYQVITDIINIRNEINASRLKKRKIFN